MMKRIIFAVCVLILISGCTDNYRPTGSVVNNIIQTDANSIAENLIYQTIADFIPWADVNVSDQLDLNASSTIDWLALNNYPTGCAAGQAVRIIGDTVTCINVGGGAGTTYTSGTPATIEVDFDANTISQNFDGNFHSRFQAVFDSNFNLNTYGSADFNSIYKNSGGGAFYYAGASLILEPDSNKFNVNDANLPFVRSSIYNAGFPIADGNITSVSLSKVIFDTNGNIDYNHLSTENPNLTLPTLTGQSGKYLTTNGTVLSWGTINASGGNCDNNSSCHIASLFDANFYANLNAKKVKTNSLSSVDYNSLSLQTNNMTRMRITEDGIVGIGTTTPQNQLNVIGDTNIVGDLFATKLKANVLSSIDVNSLSLQTNDDTKMTILADGNVGIGTILPHNNLEIVNDLNVNNGVAYGGVLFTYPKIDGSNGQILKTNGSGILTWQNDNTGGGVGGSCDNNANCTLITNNNAIFHSDANVNGTIYTNTLSSQDNNLLSIKTNGTTKMTILSDGNVGIGTTTPGAKLQVNATSSNDKNVFSVVNSSGNAIIEVIESGSLHVGNPLANTILSAEKNQNGFTTFKLQNSNAIGTSAASAFSVANDKSTIQFIVHGSGRTGVRNGITLGNWAELFVPGTANGLMISSQTSKPIVLGVNNAEVMRLISGGSIGIGTTTPTSRVAITDTGDNNIFFLSDADGSCEALPEAGGLTWSCSSDVSLKQNIIDADKEKALNDLLNARIRNYNIISTGDKATGVIAQEYELLFPNKVRDINITQTVGYTDQNQEYENPETHETKTVIKEVPVLETTQIKTVDQPSVWELTLAIQALYDKINTMEQETCADKPTWSWC